MADGKRIDLAQLKVGDRLAEHVCGPITRTTLALFAGASNDHNPIHIDSDIARAAGMGDVFAHGMLSMAYLAQALTRWVPQSRLLRWGVRFAAITPLHATVRVTGEITAISEEDGATVAEITISTTTEGAVVTLFGQAFVSLA